MFLLVAMSDLGPGGIPKSEIIKMHERSLNIYSQICMSSVRVLATNHTSGRTRIQIEDIIVPKREIINIRDRSLNIYSRK